MGVVKIGSFVHFGMITKAVNKYVERNSLPQAETIAHDERCSNASHSNNKREKRATNAKVNFPIGCRLPTPPLYSHKNIDIVNTKCYNMFIL